jgi:hypothetical protein
MDLFPEARLKVLEFYAGSYRKIKARHKELDIYHKLHINYEQDEAKYYIYGDIVRNLMEDQIKWIKDKGHKRIITEDNGFNSLKMAVDAANLTKNAEKN